MDKERKKGTRDEDMKEITTRLISTAFLLVTEYYKLKLSVALITLRLTRGPLM
jgi:hypothetical protein